ncbi:MAG: DUF4369 domain-containing protein [Bacteroidales bacterium]|nr:DUF4369 domain-containing protein [Bacteroidales bacterium]
MKRTLILAALLAAGVFASCGRDQYRIHGRVTSNELEGVRIFLVPVGHEEPWNVDSLEIHNHEFSFKGRKHWMCAIRLDWHHRDKGQNLLVATEPGDIYVTIGPDSHGGGTPQNDSLQVWKDMTIEKNLRYSEFRGAGRKDLADSLQTAYRERTQAMALALGEESIAGAFLLSMYPLPKEQ